MSRLHRARLGTGTGSTATTYYVSPNGSDAADGRSTATPWATVGRVNAAQASLVPGARVLFERGGVWSGTRLDITANGTAAAPITVGCYGSAADRPCFLGGPSDTSIGNFQPIEVHGDWVILEELWARRSNYTGIDIYGDNVIVRRCEASNCPVGMDQDITAFNSEFDSCVYLFNNFVIVGPGTDDDSGANGQAVHGTTCRVHHGTFSGHYGPAPDYPEGDGSCVEIYGATDVEVDHNYAADNLAFSEIGNGNTRGVHYHHNVVYEPTRGNFGFINVQGANWGSPYDTTIEFNTVYAPAGTQTQGVIIGTHTEWTASTVLALGKRIVVPAATGNNQMYEVTVAGTTGASQPTWPTTGTTPFTNGSVTFVRKGQIATIRNNVMRVSWKSGFTGQPVDENNNLFYGHTQQQIKSINHATKTGTGPNTLLTQAPIFTSTTLPDLSLASGSPGIDAGAATSLTTDYLGNPRTFGTAPDMGAYERQTIASGSGPATLGHFISGGVEATSFKVNAVVTDTSTATMEIVASPNADMSAPVGTSQVVALSAGDSSNGYAGTAQISGLTANTQYYYRVKINGTLQGATKRVKTHPTPGTAVSFSFGAGSCQRNGGSANPTVWTNIRDFASPPLAFVQHMGDLHYENGIVWSSDSMPRAAHNRELRWAGLSDYLAVNSFKYIPDDHDTGIDNGWAGSSSMPFAQRVFRQWMPSYDLPAGGPTRPMHHRYQYGRVLFIVTDNRTDRSNPADTDNSAKTMLGSFGKQWFKDQLTAAAAEVTAGNVRLIVWICPNRWNGAPSAGGDSWAGYDTERQELAAHWTALGLNNRILAISGDNHASMYDDGSHTVGGIRCFHAAPFNQGTSAPGGTWSSGPYYAVEQMFGVVTVTDPGGASEVDVSIQLRNGMTSALIPEVSGSFSTSSAPGGGGGGGGGGAVGQVPVVTSSEAMNTTAVTTHAITCPESSGTRAGHVAYVQLTTNGSTLTAPNPPTGWVQIFVDQASNPRMWIFRRILDGTATDNFSQSTSAAMVSSLTYTVLSGQNSTPEDTAVASASYAGTDQIVATAPSITVATAGSSLLAWYACNSSVVTFPTADMTILQDTGAGKSAMVAHQADRPAGATGGRSATMSAARNWLAAIVAVRPATALSSYVSAVSGRSPLAWLRLGESSGTTAADVQGAHAGTYVNAPTLGVTGMVGGDTAATFDRAQSERVTWTTLGTIGANILTSSWKFWIKTTDTTNSACVIGSFSTGTSQAFQILTNRSASDSFLAGSTLFYVRGTDGKQIRGAISANIYDGARHSVICVVTSATTFAVYVDGVSVSVTYNNNTTPVTFANFEFPLFIAARNLRGVADNHLSATLDEVAVFPSRLSAADAAAIHSAGVAS